MKYLKAFERDEQGYHVGDYIFINSILFKDKQVRGAKLIENDDAGRSAGFNALLASGEKIWIYNSLILRTMTQDEITQFELELSANKFNL